MVARNTVYSTETISETLAHQLTEQKKDLKSPWSKYYQLEFELVRRRRRSVRGRLAIYAKLLPNDKPHYV